jgi:hypothetical protein
MMKRFVFTMVLMFAVAAIAHAANSNVEGKWSIQTSVAGTDGTAVCTFTQKDETLTGNCIGDDKIEHKLTGSVKADTATWQYDSDYNGTPLTIVFSGAVKDENQFTGTIDVQPMGVSGDFTAKRQK